MKTPVRAIVRAPVLLRANNQITDAVRADDLESARSLMPELRESHDAVVKALETLQG